MSFHRETPHTNNRNIAMRINPSTRLNMTCCPKIGLTLFSSVVASRGRYLYMKMKKATEKAMFRPAIHPVISNFLTGTLLLLLSVVASSASLPLNSSSAALAENFSALNPSVMAWPSVITPRTIGQPIHLCCSEGRSSGSLWVTISPEGLRTAMPQACGERIITPSSTACPPTRVSSPLSKAGKSCTAAKKRTICCQRRIAIGCSTEEGRFEARFEVHDSTVRTVLRRTRPGSHRSISLYVNRLTRVLVRQRGAAVVRCPAGRKQNPRSRIVSKHAALCPDLRRDRRHYQETRENGLSCDLLKGGTA